MSKFICPICGNSDPLYIGYINDIPYCRACIKFKGKKADINFKPQENLSLELKYPLSEKQNEISLQAFNAIKEHKNVLIHAVTGAGKTELVYKSMEYILSKRGHVGFATPRKDVVIDLAPRIKEAFQKANVITVYGSHNEILEGDIILLTTHQTYHYTNYFDLIILDEIDAFPYKDNKVLNSLFHSSVRGNYILLSATPSESDIENIKKDNGIILSLYERYHHKKIPVPEFKISVFFFLPILCLYYLRKFLKQNFSVFIFTPTIEMGRKLFGFLGHFIPNGSFVSSKEEFRRLDIEKFKNNEFKFLVTTSILERGVTVKNLQVIVYKANSEIFNASSLIQISGRVGRKIDASSGSVLFLASEINTEMEQAKDEISNYNKKANLL